MVKHSFKFPWNPLLLKHYRDFIKLIGTVCYFCHKIIHAQVSTSLEMPSALIQVVAYEPPTSSSCKKILDIFQISMEMLVVKYYQHAQVQISI